MVGEQPIPLAAQRENQGVRSLSSPLLGSVPTDVLYDLPKVIRGAIPLQMACVLATKRVALRFAQGIMVNRVGKLPRT